jgi:hypothetical protein
MKGILSRIVFASILLAAVGVSGAPASAATKGPMLVVSNPAAGDFLRRGRYIIEGVAYDEAARTGTGVDQVTVYVGDRETGGLYAGTATLDQANTQGHKNPQFAKAGWKLTTTRALTPGSQVLYVYARSAVTGAETLVTIQVHVDRKTS